MSLQRNSGDSRTTWIFGNCELDELSRQLRVDGKLVELETKPLEVLRQLLLRAGEVVTKQELFDLVWPGLVVVDGSLATAVSKLRRALNDRDATMIATVARVGYRFDATVRVRHTEEPIVLAPLSGQTAELISTSAAQPTRSRPISPGWFAAVSVVCLILLAAPVFLSSKRRLTPPGPAANSVAVLPFQNTDTNADLDYLRVSLADEVATELSNVRSLSVRPSTTTDKALAVDPDVLRVGHTLNVTNVVTGHYGTEDGQLRVTMEATNVQNNRVIWRDSLSAPVGDLLALRDQIVARTKGHLAVALGAGRQSSADIRPASNEAYELYLRSLSFPYDPEPSKEARQMLEKSIELDASFAPAWLMLSRRYYVDTRYASGNDPAMSRFEAALERSRVLNPNDVAASAGLVAYHTERGELEKALEEAQDLVHRRPDSADAHYSLSYVFRYAGLLEKAATQCDIAFLLDRHTQNSGLRSCAVVFLLGGNYERAMDYVRLDPPGSSWSKALSAHIFLRSGRGDEAVRLGPPGIPQWRSFDALVACANHQPSAEVDALTSRVQPADDPETNYFAASHLAYCGKTDAALALLKQAILGGYCSYPALDTDPFFIKVRNLPQFGKLRASGAKCQARFVLEPGLIKLSRW